jgi:hypothetical protein
MRVSTTKATIRGGEQRDPVLPSQMEEEVAKTMLGAVNDKATEMVARLREDCPEPTMRWAVIRQMLVVDLNSSI